ncbi:hypothetical protein ABIC89_001039 [Variovorax boronicumulans]|uniref:hypothetical protein n=1 Tax=Variovorax boronicumulans TaxID=436515 RepID=UPI003396542D
MSLPAAWVDRIFDKLTLTYGQVFLRRWQDIDMNAVKSDWAHELSGFERFPKSIAWALQNIPPDKPPTVLEFRAIARRAPEEEQPRIEQAAAGKERIAAELAKLGPILAKTAPTGDSLDWARRVVQRHECGAYKATRTSLAMARDALGVEA